jgi:hypothetical protein
MPSSTSKQDDINRRDFLRRTALGAAGIALTSALPPFPRGNICADGQVSRIVIVTDEAASSGTTIVPDVVQVMMDRGVMELTGEPSVSQAWQSLLPGLVPTSRIGIKVNCINRYLSSHPQVVQAIVDELATIEIGQTALPRNNIVVWDRHNYELTRAGYSVYSGYDPHLHRCFGTDQAGYGYDDASSIQVHGQTCHPSIILTQHCDYLINLSVLKNHTMAGTTGSLKNHFGSIHNPEELHGAPSQYCDPFIPALNRRYSMSWALPRQSVSAMPFLASPTEGPADIPSLPTMACC